MTTYAIPLAAFEPMQSCGVTGCVDPAHRRSRRVIVRTLGEQFDLYVDGKRWQG